jgi:hypothetical protein
MQIVSNLGTLRSDIPYWVPAVTAPTRDWIGAPGCRRGARFLVDATTFRPARGNFPAFESRAECLRWIMAHQIDIAGHAPEAHAHAVSLAEWMLGVDAV